VIGVVDGGFPLVLTVVSQHFTARTRKGVKVMDRFLTRRMQKIWKL
jgi:hypothetical protein